jgi:nitrite reductase/ring-hydroxylating ferredoxin subunit
MPIKHPVLCSVNQITELKSKKVILKRGKETIEVFIVRFKGKFHAYVNRCKHISLPLDWGDNDFFTSDGEFLMCKNHGAIYAPDSGTCVAGPCAGQSLEAIPIRVVKGKILYIEPSSTANNSAES